MMGRGEISWSEQASGSCGWKAPRGWRGSSSRWAGQQHPSEARWLRTKRLVTRSGHLRLVRLRVDLDHFREPDCRRLGLVAAHLRLVDSDPEYRAILNDGNAVLSEQLTALGIEAPLRQSVRAVELGLHDAGLPACLPLTGLLGQPGLGFVPSSLQVRRERSTRTTTWRVAVEPSRDTDPTATVGFSGPIPGDERLEQLVHRWRRRSRRDGIGERSFALRAAASAAAACLERRRCGSDAEAEGTFRIRPAPGRGRAAGIQSGSDRTLGMPVGRTQRHRVILPLASAMGSVADMGIYAKRPARMIGQLLGDGFVLLWTIGWAIVGIFVHRVIEVLATPPGRQRGPQSDWPRTFDRPRRKRQRCQSPVTSCGGPSTPPR
mgnify:CR=1 FL=1